MTKLKLESKRFIRTVESGLKPNTQYLGMMLRTSDDIKTADWIESAKTESELPINSPSLEITAPDKYDAYHQSSEADAGTGKQNVVAGMSVYRIALPAESSATFVDNVNFYLASDKFCVGGLKVAAILSDSITPPTDWDLLRSGGTDAGIVAGFATVGDLESTVEVRGVLAETSDTITGSVNHAGAFNLDLSSVTTSYSYLYLAVSLFDYQTYRREYWVEGSGLLDGYSIEVEFNDSVVLASTDDDMPLFLSDIVLADADSSYSSFTAGGSALVLVKTKIKDQAGFNEGVTFDTFKKIDILNAGLIWKQSAPVLACTYPDTAQDISASVYYPLASVPLVGSAGSVAISSLFCWVEKNPVKPTSVDFGTVIARFFCPWTKTQGRSLNFTLEPLADKKGTFSARIIVINSVDPAYMPELSDPSILNGTHDSCIGSDVFSSNATAVAVTITRDITAGYLFCFLLIDSITTSDSIGTAAEVCGYPPGLYGSNKHTAGFLLNNVSITTGV